MGEDKFEIMIEYNYDDDNEESKAELASLFDKLQDVVSDILQYSTFLKVKARFLDEEEGKASERHVSLDDFYKKKGWRR